MQSLINDDIYIYKLFQNNKKRIILHKNIEMYYVNNDSFKKQESFHFLFPIFNICYSNANDSTIIKNIYKR